MITLPLKNFEPMTTTRHFLMEEEMKLSKFLKENNFQIGDMIKIENKKECRLPLFDNEYCLTFDKGDLYIEEPFSLKECKTIFGEEFNY
jgi:hypothetical protein